MEFFLLLIAGAAIAYWFFNRSQPDKQQPDFNFHADDFLDDEERVPTWQTREYQWGKETRKKDYVALHSDVQLAGFAKRGGKPFLDAIIPKETSLDLVRDPENVIDPNAIKLTAKLKTTSEKTTIGYLPKEIAAEIAEQYTDELPLEPELRRVGWKTDNPDASFMVINVLAPNAAKRKKYKK